MGFLFGFFMFLSKGAHGTLEMTTKCLRKLGGLTIQNGGSLAHDLKLFTFARQNAQKRTRDVSPLSWSLFFCGTPFYITPLRLGKGTQFNQSQNLGAYFQTWKVCPGSTLTPSVSLRGQSLCVSQLSEASWVKYSNSLT